jgi:ATP-binding protein involved in chromosome partitioning
VPLTMNIRETSDAGTPVVAAEPDSPQAQIYRGIAARVWERLQVEAAAAEGATPAIVFE